MPGMSKSGMPGAMPAAAQPAAHMGGVTPGAFGKSAAFAKSVPSGSPPPPPPGGFPAGGSFAKSTSKASLPPGGMPPPPPQGNYAIPSKYGGVPGLPPPPAMAPSGEVEEEAPWKSFRRKRA